jgi:ParB family chromosome partitioning protein
MYPDDRDEVVQLYLDDIIPNRFQPREVFDEKALKELAVSIKEHGVIQPIIVRNVNGKYEIIAGERRYKASALAGLTKIPAIIRDLDDKESSKVALLENLQRKNLNPIEEARTYQKILEIDQMTQDELAKTMGKSQSAVANKIRLLSLPDVVQDALLKEQISERHARTLLNVPDAKKQKEMLKKVIDNKMSVRSLEDEIKKLYPKENKEESEEVPTDISPRTIFPTTASSTDFVNSSPLVPTAELPKDESNYGKVTIAPPQGEDMPITSKFLNYAVKEEADEEDDDVDDSVLNIPTTITTVDVNKEKNNSEDLASKNSGSADIDSLLNIDSATNQKNKEYITPAEKIVKTNLDEKHNSEDYFKTSDLSSIELPTTVIEDEPVSEEETVPTVSKEALLNMNGSDTTPEETSTNLTPTPIAPPTSDKYSIDDATNKIRSLVEDLKSHGINIKCDEMNFGKTYQVILKIDKEQ